MDTALETRLASLGITPEKAALLAAEGVTVEGDMTFLTAAQIKELTGCGMVTAAKVVAAFAVPVAPAVSAGPVVPGGAPAEPVSPYAEVPEGTSPSVAQVNSAATFLGMDPSMMQMMMMGSLAGNAGMGGMDISGMIPVATLVSAYNPKVRNPFLMLMGALEQRLGVPIVVINEDGSINQALTSEYITGLEEGRDAAEDNIYYDSDGAPHEVIAVGVDAQSVYDADPIKSTSALQKNGMGVGRVNWTGVADDVRQVAFYAAQTGELTSTNESHVAWLRDHIKAGCTRFIFQGQAPKAISAYNEARRTGSLPTLRVMLSRSPRRPEYMPRRRRVVPAGLGRTEDDR